MKNKNGEIIYIGKAKSLKNRVTQYFGAGNQHTEKVKRMVSSVDEFEYVLCDSEFEALILENSLIKQNQPKYNILLKDDKGYHYIKITNEKWRRITTSMQTDDKTAEYIGPYYSSSVVKDTVDEVRKIFKLPDCNRSFDRPSKPCLNFHIGLCDAPCRASVTPQMYNETVKSAVFYIKNSSDIIIKTLTQNMQIAAEKLDFEYAAKLRDRIKAIKKIEEKQKVVMCTYKNQDVFAGALIDGTACIAVLVFRNSRLVDKKHYIIDAFVDKSELYSQFLQQYYAQSSDIPPRILIDTGFENLQLIEHWLCEKANKKIEILLPKRGEQKDLVNMCIKNAVDNLSQKSEINSREISALSELSRLLGLKNPPRIIEAYDISNTAGDENVAGMVTFRAGRPLKSHYRMFKIKSFVGQDDYRSMAEVLDRRFTEYEKGEDEGFAALPDLILLDGGKGQISAVEPILKKHNINIPLFGMVKDSKHKTRAIASSGGDILIKANRSAYGLVTSIQDEVHRFAIGYHKKRRTKKMLDSELTVINGIGKAKAASLLKHFKTVKAIKNADLEQLTEVKGINADLAQKIYNEFH